MLIAIMPAAKCQGSSLLDRLTAEWPRLTGEPPGRFRLMKVSSRPGQNLPILFFLFREGASRPDYALKVNRNPEYPDAILREFRNYSAIYARAGGSGLSMPRPLFCAPVGSHVVLCETVVPGRRCEDRYFSVRLGWWRRRAIERFLGQAVTWAREFHLRTRVGARAIDRSVLDAEFVRPLADFADRPEVDRRTASRLVAFADRVPRLIGMRRPVTAVHGDFDHGNILFEKDQISVVDWEDCEAEGNPFVDLAYLIFHLALVSDLSADRHRRLRAFFDPRSWSFELTRRSLDDYATALDLDPAIFWLALPGTVVEILTRDYGPERDPRSIPLYSLEMLDFALELAARETGDGRP